MSAIKTRIMYVENKSQGLNGPARIGRVTFSKTGKTLRYRGKTFQSLKGVGFKSNYLEIESGEEYWISGPHKDGSDRLYGGSTGVDVDEDVAEEYWVQIRGRKPPTLRNGGPSKGQPTASPRATEPGSVRHSGRASGKISMLIARRSKIRQMS